eukprot:2867994-Rhodomonas_salina.1
MCIRDSLSADWTDKSAVGCAPYRPTLSLRNLRYWRTCVISLWACYAMSGTDVAYGATSFGLLAAESGQLRYCYAMSGTDIMFRAIGLGACYALSGTDSAYDAARKL